MNRKVYYAILMVAFFFSASAIAQMDRSVGQSQYKRGGGGNSKKGAAPDFVVETLKYYTKELTLDSFQQAAMKNILEEQREPINVLMADKAMTSDERRDRGKAINDIIDAKVLPLLSETQKARYLELQEKRKKY